MLDPPTPPPPYLICGPGWDGGVAEEVRWLGAPWAHTGSHLPPSLIMGSTVRVDHSTHQDYGPSFEGPSSNRKRNGTFSETPFQVQKSCFFLQESISNTPIKTWNINLFHRQSIYFMRIPFILWKIYFLNRFSLMMSSGFGHVFPNQENGNSI